MKKIVLCCMTSFTLMACPAMAEENKDAASVTEQTDAGENCGRRVLLPGNRRGISLKRRDWFKDYENS